MLLFVLPLNKKSTVLNISLSPDAGAELSMLCTQYEDDRWLLYRKEEQQAEYLSKEIALSSPVWSNVKIAEDKRFGNPPVLTICAEAKVRKCASVAGTTMFVPIMPCDFYALSSVGR
ncbi:MAG: hypothetical protein K5854_04300 [Prevotella sp.]|nr:hypothetical protein [Prevotella sp.]